MKEMWHRFLDDYLMWIFGIGGFLAALYCVWLQSGGISVATGKPVVSIGFHYISFYLAFAVVAAGIVGGYAINRYFRNEAEKSSEIRKLTPEDFIHTARGFLLLFIISALAGFLMAEVLWVLVGVFGMVFASSGLVWYKIWVIQWEKEKEKKAAS